MKGSTLSGTVKAFLIASVALIPPVAAADQCVNPRANDGCKSSINAAIAAAGPNETITVGPGVYAEYVVVNKPVALIAQNQNTIIDANGLINGINVDGFHNTGLSHVIISGFTVANANQQGILVTNASDVTITGNHVIGNDRSLQPFANGGPACPGIPPYLAGGENMDCGEGINLSGVSDSIVSGNLVERNAGGILISDDTGPNHENLITGNVVQDNPYDCGITIASHHFALSVQDPTLGVYHITVTGNTSRRNGLATHEGAGIGIFAGPPGAQNWGDVVAGNIATDNALPGVALHAHSPFQKLTDHLITGNTIAGNGPDPDPGTTVPTGISVFTDPATMPGTLAGVVITGNTIKSEGIDVGINTSGTVDLHLNNFFDSIGIDNLGTGFVSATLNWWKCAHGPGSNGCGTAVGANVLVSPWLSQPSQQPGI